MNDASVLVYFVAAGTMREDGSTRELMPARRVASVPREGELVALARRGLFRVASIIWSFPNDPRDVVSVKLELEAP